MKNGFLLTLLLSSALLSLWALGCQPATDNSESVYQESTSIAVVYITGEYYPDYEAYILEGADPATDVVWGKRVVNAVVVDYLKGSGPKELVVVVPCGRRTPAVKTRALVSINSVNEALILVTPTEEELRQFIDRTVKRERPK